MVESTAKLEALGSERYGVSGVLDAVTTPKLLEDSASKFTAQSGVEIYVDLAGVSESDSSGLALVIEWLRLARQRGQRMRFANLPKQLLALARISEVEELIQPEAA
jgi:phospholipid transport system transporter-binding protein